MMAPWNDSDLLDDQPEGEENDYRPISGLALVAFGLALLSLSAWLNPAMWFVSLIGVLVAAIALRRIARSDPPMLGRKLALFALALSLIGAVGVVADWYVYRLLIRQEAREYAEYWIDLQRQGNTRTASRLVRPIPILSANPNLTDAERVESAFASYSNRPEVRALMALGSRAQIRYYDTEKQKYDGRNDSLKQVYAVTYNKDGKKTTFFLRMAMERQVPSDKPVGVWQITSIETGVKPLALGGTDES